MERTTEFKILIKNFLRDFDCSGDYIEQQMYLLLEDIFEQGYREGYKEGRSDEYSFQNEGKC